MKVRIKDGKNFNGNDQLLPCDLNELGCGKISSDLYAYTLKATENWILSFLKEDYAHMLKNDNHYFIVIQNTSENKYFLEVKNHPQHFVTNQQNFIQSHTAQCTLQFTVVDSIWKQDEKLTKWVLIFCSIRITHSFWNLETSTPIVLKPYQPIPNSTDG